MNTDKPINILIQEFISDIEKSEGTKKLYKKTLEYFITWCTKNEADVRDITRADILRYKNSLITAGRSAATIDNYISSIRKFFAWLTDEGFINKNPTEGIEWMRDKHATFIKSALSIDQIYKLLDSVKANTTIGFRNYALINLMCFTGLRCIEVSRLNIEDMRLAANKWHLQIQRKGSNEKSGSIVIPIDIVKPIKEYWRYRSGELTEDRPLFVNHAPRSTNTRLTPVSISRIIKGSLIKIGLNSNKFTAHSLRHTAATLAYFAGSENWEIGKMLGHKNPRQTEHYIHCLGIDSGDEGKAIMKINEYARKHKEKQKELDKS
jgi:site-specific recombinase XerD